jgi:hypothetical protein
MSSVQPHFQWLDKRGVVVGKITFIFFFEKQLAIIFSAVFLCSTSNFLAGQVEGQFAPCLGMNTELQLGQFFTNFPFFSSQKYIYYLLLITKYFMRALSREFTNSLTFLLLGEDLAFKLVSEL